MRQHHLPSQSWILTVIRMGFIISASVFRGHTANALSENNHVPTVGNPRQCDAFKTPHWIDDPLPQDTSPSSFQPIRLSSKALQTIMKHGDVDRFQKFLDLIV